ncbi:MAG TPA: hypothetical protein VNE39_24225 [Planctomycetota bacterium]|nr:hypothetical protein [Planctomycetota bacterium]
MGDESPKCQGCGAELEGRDIYEGMCKACREEAVLGSQAPRPRTLRAPRPASQRPAGRPVPPDAIAIEATVDLDADTKEIGPQDEALPLTDSASQPTEEAASEPLAPPGPADTGEPASPEPTSAAPRPAAAQQAPDLPLLEFEAPDAPRTAAPPVAPESKPPRAERSITIKKLRQPDHPEPELDMAEAPAPARRRIAPREPQPRLERPIPSSHETHAPLALATDQEHKHVAEPAASAPAADLPVLEAEPRDRPSSPPLAPPPSRPAAPAARAPEDIELLRIEADTASGNLRSLLDEMAGQVEQLSRVLSTAHRVAPSAFWFGFRACFGFAVGMVVLAAVAVGLLALIGVLFYPPAFDLVRQLFGQISPR